MNAHIAYLRYVLRHKWWVLVASRRTGCSFVRAAIHDWSKFLPREWFAYVHSFYNSDGTPRKVRDSTGAYDPSKISREFDYAWLSHIRLNAHHWQHWVLINDEDGTYALPIPEKYLREMLADWIGAAMAQGRGSNPRIWYEKNGPKMILAATTRAQLEFYINELSGPEAQCAR